MMTTATTTTAGISLPAHIFVGSRVHGEVDLVVLQVVSGDDDSCGTHDSDNVQQFSTAHPSCEQWSSDSHRRDGEGVAPFSAWFMDLEPIATNVGHSPSRDTWEMEPATPFAFDSPDTLSTLEPDGACEMSDTDAPAR